MSPIKALSLWQPWASLIALGVKTIETRSWSTSYRGPLAIHAARTAEHIEHLITAGYRHEHEEAIVEALKAAGVGLWSVLPLGAVVATCELVDVVPIVHMSVDPMLPLYQRHVAEMLYPPHPLHIWTADEDGVWRVEDIRDQRPYGGYAPGRYAWLLDKVTPVDPPVRAKGRQGLWDWEPDDGGRR